MNIKKVFAAGIVALAASWQILGQFKCKSTAMCISEFRYTKKF